MEKKMSPKNRLLSFKYAFNGFCELIKNEPNARIHTAVSIIVIIGGIVLNLNTIEWVCIFFAIGLVISMEAINTALENLSDFVSPQKHAQIKKVKDIAAFAVLFCAIISVIIGLLIFIPKIIILFET